MAGVGILQRLFRWAASSAPIASPWVPADSLVTFAIGEAVGAIGRNDVVTRELARRVAPLRRSENLICALVAAMPLVAQEGANPVATQPAWLSNSASGISPYHRMHGVIADLFWDGWAAVGFELGDDDLPIDALHIPAGYWRVDQQTGQVSVDERIPTEYRQRVILIPLGGSGVLVDGQDIIRAHRHIERAWTSRVQNPVPQTALLIQDEKYDALSRKEKLKLVKSWNEQRRLDDGATALIPSFIKPEAMGQVSADLFEKGRNAIRLDIANLTDLPASILEGSKDGSGGDIRYSNETGKRAELFDFGILRYVKAIEARLSLDDVCAPGVSIRFDRTELTSIPTPNTSAPTED